MSKKHILSQKLLILKYYTKCQKNLKIVVTVFLFTFPYVAFSLSKLAFKNAF